MYHRSSEAPSPKRVYHDHILTYFLSKIHFNIMIPSAPVLRIISYLHVFRGNFYNVSYAPPIKTLIL